jgi:hypothetical protein
MHSIDMLPEDARKMLREASEQDRVFLHVAPHRTRCARGLADPCPPEDVIKDGLRTWAMIAAEDKDDAREKYAAWPLLARWVFDKEYHPERKRAKNRPALPVAALRYHYYKTNGRQGHARRTHLTKMSAPNLYLGSSARHVAGIPNNRLGARAKMHLKQRNWGDAYGMVPYDMEKAVTGEQKKLTIGTFLRNPGKRAGFAETAPTSA